MTQYYCPMCSEELGHDGYCENCGYCCDMDDEE